MIDPTNQGLGADYSSRRIDNGQPSFGPFDPTSVDPRTAPARTPYQSIEVVPQQNVNYIVGVPNVTIPPSQASPAVKPGR